MDASRWCSHFNEERAEGIKMLRKTQNLICAVPLCMVLAGCSGGNHSDRLEVHQTARGTTIPQMDNRTAQVYVGAHEPESEARPPDEVSRLDPRYDITIDQVRQYQ